MISEASAQLLMAEAIECPGWRSYEGAFMSCNRNSKCQCGGTGVAGDAMPRLAFPMTDPWTGEYPRLASELTIALCTVEHARSLIKLWHSTLPKTQRGPWQYAFAAGFGGITFGVALWHNPSARTLPGHWLELRRMAVADDAPHCTASRMLGQMARWFRKKTEGRERLISYQDLAVHKGTIYKAAGWTLVNITNARTRDRSKPRPNGRAYRTDTNGTAAHSSPKARWELVL